MIYPAIFQGIWHETVCMQAAAYGGGNAGPCQVIFNTLIAQVLEKSCFELEKFFHQPTENVFAYD